MQNSKSRFLHDSNGLPNKANEISNRWLLSCLNTWKTACQTIWGDGLIAGTEKFTPRFKPEREPLIYIYYLYNSKLVSMPTFYLQLLKFNYWSSIVDKRNLNFFLNKQWRRKLKLYLNWESNLLKKSNISLSWNHFECWYYQL